MMTRYGIGFLLCLTVVTGCERGTDPTGFRFATDTVPAGTGGTTGDSAAIYAYNTPANTANPDSLLRELWAAGLSLKEAWLPLDNLCMDPLGARLTVRLARPDPKILRFGFALGTGRLACATQLKHYSFEPSGT